MPDLFISSDKMAPTNLKNDKDTSISVPKTMEPSETNSLARSGDQPEHPVRSPKTQIDDIVKTIEHDLALQVMEEEDFKPKPYISWHEYFMSVAQLAARRSKDPATQVGACIVNAQNKIVATGYNGMPNGVQDDNIPWGKVGSYLDTKYAYVVHAELNAILNSVLTDQTGCRLYVSLFPCNECAKAVIQSGIRHVIYLSDKHKEKEATIAAKKMFAMVGVLCEKYSELAEK